MGWSPRPDEHRTASTEEYIPENAFETEIEIEDEIANASATWATREDIRRAEIIERVDSGRWLIDGRTRRVPKALERWVQCRARSLARKANAEPEEGADE